MKDGGKVAAKSDKPSTAAAIKRYFVPRNVQIAMVLAIVGGFLFIRPYLGTVLFSALLAFIFNPVYKSVLGRTRRQGLAMAATIMAALLCLILPVLIIIGITIGEASSLVSKFEHQNANIGPAQIQTIVDRGADRVEKVVEALPGGQDFHIDKAKLRDNIKQAGADFAQGLLNVIKTASGAFVGLISTFILSIFLIMAMLRYQAELVTYIKEASPFHHTVTSVYLSKAGAMTKAMVKGQLIIAVAQGFASAFSLWIVGLDYFWFFFVILTFLSFIPLGGGILTIPIGIIIALTGNVAQGLFVVLFHLLVVTNIDNLLRPRLVPKEARLNSALTLLSVFSGIALFGAIGVVYGPVIMILVITTFQMYADYNRRIKKPLPPKGTIA